MPDDTPPKKIVSKDVFDDDLEYFSINHYSSTPWTEKIAKLLNNSDHTKLTELIKELSTPYKIYKTIDDSIATLNKETFDIITKLKSDTRTQGALISELKQKLETLNKEQSLKHLITQVNDKAKIKLSYNSNFLKLFETIK